MIILINGPSSSGKTFLARALQERWRDPLIYCSLDQVISQLPFSYTGSGENALDGFPIVEGRVLAKQHGYALNEIFCDHLLNLDAAGYDVVVDYVMLDARMFEAFKVVFQKADVFFVGLTCDAEILDQRNRERSDRVPGLSLKQYEDIHFCRSHYDLEVDSTKTSSNGLALSILSAAKKKDFTHQI